MESCISRRLRWITRDEGLYFHIKPILQAAQKDLKVLGKRKKRERCIDGERRTQALPE
jgi:hypothetical protein